ncbi:DgyrCDS10387 [Dimorphilus gyrociliatus]|nr:DgyrCDS10387 [Dimorphilus gyrociliatus]
MSNPANTLPPKFDGYEPINYDPAFTVQINESMIVPNKIGLTKENSDTAPGGPQVELESKSMNVPAKIVLDGNNRHIGLPNEPRLHLDLNGLPDQAEAIVLETPPRTLSIGESKFSSMSKIEKQEETDQYPISEGFNTPKDTASSSESLLEVCVEDNRVYVGGGGEPFEKQSEQDLVMNMHSRLNTIERHITHLQDENEKMKQREIILCTVVAGYFLLKSFKWLFHKN